MAKLTKAETRLHNQALEILNQSSLTEDDKEFVYRNWHEGAVHMNGQAGAFFTPYSMAFDVAIDVGHSGRIIDLCSGIGMLSYAVWYRTAWNPPYEPRPELTCVEINPAYVEVGKKLLPEANWICASVFDVIDMDLGHFDVAISNPPFGAVARVDRNGPTYTGKEFEFHVIDIASQISDFGVFVLPQMSAGFNYSGRPFYERQKTGKAVEFQKKTGMYFEAGVGVDTEFYKSDWKGVSPLCEIVTVDFKHWRETDKNP